MKNTLLFLSTIISGALTWFAYALVASLVTGAAYNDCLNDNTVMAIFFFTGWILPALITFDLYRVLNRKQRIHEGVIRHEISQIRKNTHNTGRANFRVPSSRDFHLN